MTSELILAELLASRLCHDLAGPLGAVDNGLELLREDAAGEAAAAVDLAARSNGQAIALLQFHRYAYGRAGAAAQVEPAQLRALAKSVFETDRVQLSWPDGLLADAPAGHGKLLLTMLAVAADALPRGGALNASEDRRNPSSGARCLQVRAQGQGAALKEDLRAALAGELHGESLTPRNVHALFARRLAERLGMRLRCEHGEEDVVLEAEPAESPVG